jgi:hypothetical protein
MPEIENDRANIKSATYFRDHPRLMMCCREYFYENTVPHP